MGITMCKPKHCHLWRECYRYLKKPHSMMQSYFVEEPYNKETKTCEYYYETKPATKNTKSNESLLQDGSQL